MQDIQVEQPNLKLRLVGSAVYECDGKAWSGVVHGLVHSVLHSAQCAV